MNAITNSQNFRFFPFDIKIELFKVPKQGSTKCTLGFGFCFSIVITFIIEEGIEEEPDTSYDSETEEVSFWGAIDLNNRDIMHLHFPNEIIKSPYHSEEDFMKFIVVEDKQYGDVTFLKGEYNLERDRDGYNYRIKIKTK